MASDLKVNSEMTECVGCSKELAAGEGTQRDAWHDQQFECADCKAEREKRESDKRLLERRMGRIGQDMLPAIAKIGNVIKVDLGEGNYRQSIVIEIGNQKFTISIDSTDY